MKKLVNLDYNYLKRKEKKGQCPTPRPSKKKSVKETTFIF